MAHVLSTQQPERLSYADRLQLAWALSWPCAVFSLLYWLARGLLGLSGQHLTPLDLGVGPFQLFFFSPWVVRRTVQLDFPGFHLVVTRRQSGETTRAINYRGSLSVAWLLMWRTAVIFGIVNGLIFAAVWVVQGARPLYFDPNYVTLPGVLGILKEFQEEVLSLLIFLLWVNKAAIKKSYARFSLGFEQAGLLAGGFTIAKDLPVTIR
jgi:hypothetical protein